ncbi:abc transporter permease [Lasius niger]|uniref:Abc transporter permease n=1 Tax=Lasius niger TaxID=67767 RepID=A0A0J7K363_LASNI|nr:abc transporter permease [Lasius niger]
MASALDLSIGWGALIQETNLRNFLSLLTKDNNLLKGVNELRSGDCSIFCLVTIPRVRPHKYLDLTMAEALIFITFSMINDIVITISKRGTESLNKKLLQIPFKFYNQERGQVDKEDKTIRR